MLRSSIALNRQILSSPARQRSAAQWLSRTSPGSRLSNQRFVLGSKSPASLSFYSTVTPETSSKQSSVDQGPSSQPPRPSPRSRRTGRFRRFLLYLILSSGLAYGGGVFLALKWDSFHDIFTEYVPYGEDVVLYFQHRDFYRRFPNASKRAVTVPAPSQGRDVTIPSKSGLSWRIASEEDTGADVSKNGPHTSATEAHKIAETKITPDKSKATEMDTIVLEAKSEAAAKPERAEGPTQQIATVDLTQVRHSDEEIVQSLVKSVNDVIVAINADAKAGQYLAPISKAKEELLTAGEKILAIRDEAMTVAQEEIRQAHATFDESAREIVRHLDEARKADIAKYREEFEMEREKLARAYQQKIQTELQRAQEVAEQRIKNELVEQAIEINRKHLNDVKELVEKEREGRLGKLNELSASVKALEELTTGWQEVIDTNLKTQQLQVAVDTVRTVLERSDFPRPFIRELVAVKELAADDQVVEAAIASINPTAYQHGIPSNSQLIERFRRVAGEVRKASLLPENAGIASHAASVLLSRVTFKKDAIADSDDVESILTRTENLLEQGNIDRAAREMNGLQGWAKILSKDWLADVRKVLEVRQALEVIETQARLQCLRVG